MPGATAPAAPGDPIPGTSAVVGTSPAERIQLLPKGRNTIESVNPPVLKGYENRVNPSSIMQGLKPTPAPQPANPAESPSEQR
jgi:hypothetical protein